MVIKQTCKYTLWYLHSKIKQVTQSRTNRNCTTNQRSVGDTKNIKSTDKTKHRSTEKTKCRSKDKTKRRTVRQRDITFFFSNHAHNQPFPRHTVHKTNELCMLTDAQTRFYAPWTQVQRRWRTVACVSFTQWLSHAMPCLIAACIVAYCFF